MGKTESQREVEKKQDHASKVKPDFNFKFAKKIEERFSGTDVNKIMANAVESRFQPRGIEENQDGTDEIDLRFYEVSLDRPTGIEFATDLSLKYVYVMEVKDNSPAQLSVTPVLVGDQLVAVNDEECIGMPFAQVADLLGKNPSVPLKFRFFRGSKQELLTAVGREDYVATTAEVIVINPDGQEVTYEARAGANLRDSLIENGVQVYNVAQGRFTNCNGRQLCGTCIVDVLQGAEYTNSKSIDEENFLRKMPGSYRLSCCVNVYGDVKVKTRPPTKKKLIEFT